MKRDRLRDACLIASGYLVGALLATLACLVCGWLDRRNET